ncbi:MAG: metallophosphoesterase [Salinivirgaceae bacterium]|nr:metallophosphoesterase [Salinivirgaceae bacterium]
MKILVIPDIHGKFEDAFSVINEHKDHVDKVVVLGDYVDGYEQGLDNDSLVNDFWMLCEMARKEPDKFCLCLGNHDMSYISSGRDAIYCSRHHGDMTNYYREMFRDNLDILNVVYLIDGCLFSHAGVTMDFYKRVVGQFSKLNSKKRLSPDNERKWESLNVNPFNPETLNFIMHYDFNSRKNGISYFDLMGDDVYGNSDDASCVWVRPWTLGYAKDWPPQIKCQVVGHTKVGLNYYQVGNNRFIITDSEEGNKYLLLDTSTTESLPWRIVTSLIDGPTEWLHILLRFE